MASKSNPHAQVFEDKTVDASISPVCWILCAPLACFAIPYKTIIDFGQEEVTKTDTTICGQGVSKRPYGELGAVAKGNCLCCVSVSSSFGEISPGLGCDNEKVDQIHDELKQRMRGRGDTAQIQRAEQTLQRLDDMDNKLDAIMKHLNITTSPTSDAIGRA